MATETYSYRPLTQKRNIRVIRLEGSDISDSPLQVELVEVSLDIPPKYFAVSYCWGGQTPDCCILCEGKNLLITSNCQGALQRFRPRVNQHALLWIDAICINQSVLDNSERNHQVSLMGEIYATAEQVWVWLGSQQLDPLPPGDIEIVKWLRDLDVASTNPVETEAESKLVRLAEAVDLIGTCSPILACVAHLLPTAVMPFHASFLFLG
jgi:hypothetical protein